jgi:putative peptidoglycan lipid II flippase
MTLLVPLAVVVWLAAGPIISLLAGDAAPAQLAVGERMLRVFAPQLPLYGIGIVLTGVLQAHRRFTWPVLAPLLSSLTVVAAYLSFAVVQGPGTPIDQVSHSGELLLSVGTTLGVVVMSGCLFIPMSRLGLRLRPTYQFAGELRRVAGGLALAGAVTVAAQQLALVVALRLALTGPSGTNVQYNVAQQIYLLPWAVLAVPVATASFPVLATAVATGEPERYRSTLATTARSVLLLSCLGAATLIAAAQPAAALLNVSGGAAAIAGFAPGLLGYGLFALLSRALYARGDTRAAAAATVSGWVVVAASTAVLAVGMPVERRALALALANSIGMLVLGAVLLVVVARKVGPAVLHGFGRAAAVGLVGGAAGAVAGLAVLDVAKVSAPSVIVALAEGALAAGVATVVFAVVAYVGDRHDVRPLATSLLRRLRRRTGARV